MKKTHLLIAALAVVLIILGAAWLYADRPIAADPRAEGELMAAIGAVPAPTTTPAVAATTTITWTCTITPPPASLKLDPFYKKFCLVGGIPVVSSGAVSDKALTNVASMMKGMLEKRPDAMKKLAEKKVKVAIIGTKEVTTDIPEYRNLNKQFPGTDWNKRTRGIGATSYIPVSSVAEENVLCSATDVYKGESIFIHEFAHSFKDLGINLVDSTFDKKLTDAYAAARKKGLWNNTYAAGNKEEYWAEGVQAYFGSNFVANPANGVHNHVNGSAMLKAYDPTLHSLVYAGYKSNWTWKCGK